jgi:hypothetical protein
MKRTFNTWRELMADALSAHKRPVEGHLIVTNLQFTPSAEALARAEAVRQRVRANLAATKTPPDPV